MGNRHRFDGGSRFRAWLYRIATNVCLDALRRRARRPVAARSYAEVPCVLRLVDGAIAEITTFGPSTFPSLGLPPTITPTS